MERPQTQNLVIIAKRVWSMVRVVYTMLRKSISKRKLLLAGKAIGNTLHRHRGSHQSPHHLAYEFSCSNSPAFPGFNSKRRRHHPFDDLAAVNAVVEMMNNSEPLMASPLVCAHARELRVTDSPFPLKEADEDSRVVDKAADDFIRKFYTDLKHQTS